MRAVVCRVRGASVAVEDGPCAGQLRRIGPGLLVLVGVGEGDGPPEALRLADKILALRIFPDESGRFARDVGQAGGQILAISQFTLYASLKGGRRPDFSGAARPETARGLYQLFLERLASTGRSVSAGEFGAAMAVESVNDGPVTIPLDTAAL